MNIIDILIGRFGLTQEQADKLHSYEYLQMVLDAAGKSHWPVVKNYLYVIGVRYTALEGF